MQLLKSDAWCSACASAVLCVFSRLVDNVDGNGDLIAFACPLLLSFGRARFQSFDGGVNLGYETDIDHLISKWTGHYLTRGQHKRARFRRLHHYFSYLKYWDIYQQKFAYLDAKSQGLLAMAAILTAIFTVLIGGSAIFENDALHSLASWGSFFGIFLLIAAQVLLLRCFSTTADSTFPSFDEEAAKLEMRICSGGGKNFFGRTRILESNMDSFLTLHLQMIQETSNTSHFVNLRLKQKWEEIRANSDDTFESFEEDVSAFFGRLRDAVEDEVSKRHDDYHMARRLVLTSLFLLLACVVTYSIDKSWLIYFRGI